jgi:general secretion pathway protein N
MIGALMRRPLVAALAGVAILLALAIGLEIATGSPASNGAPAQGKAAPSPDAKLLPPVLAQAPEQAYPEMAARPLFTPTRRPAPVEPAQGKQTFAKGQYLLQGVIVVGDQRTALLKEKSTGKVHRVDRGNDLNGIKVERVEPTEVVLASGDERERIALVVQRPEGAARAATAAPEAPAGPFSTTPPVPPAASAPPQPAQPVAAAGQPAAVPNPAARAATMPGATNPAAPAQPPTSQPMTPEELLARRRARRNQPTQ